MECPSYDCKVPFLSAPTRREMLRTVFLSALFAVAFSQAPKCGKATTDSAVTTKTGNVLLSYSIQCLFLTCLYREPQAMAGTILPGMCVKCLLYHRGVHVLSSSRVAIKAEAFYCFIDLSFYPPSSILHCR